MSRPVTLVAWEDATKKPPPVGPSNLVWTDQGEARLSPNGRWMWPQGEYISDPQPSVWCDPTPPGPDALTVEDLTAIADAADAFVRHLMERGNKEAVEAPLARLRAAICALDALGNGGTE